MLPENQLSPSSSSLPLYSKRAVRGFSVLFSAIAGGAMTAQNLRDMGQPAAARQALWASIGYTAVVMWLASYLPDRAGGVWFPLLVGYAGAMGLEAYSDKFVANREAHPAKSIRKPLLICLAVFVPLMALFIYALVITGGSNGSPTV